MKVMHFMSRLAGKYRWRKFPAVITVLGNTLNFAEVGNTGKYDILELILLNIHSSFFKFNIKFKLLAYNCYPLHAYHANKVMQRTTSWLFHRL